MTLKPFPDMHMNESPLVSRCLELLLSPMICQSVRQLGSCILWWCVSRRTNWKIRYCTFRCERSMTLTWDEVFETAYSVEKDERRLKMPQEGICQSSRLIFHSRPLSPWRWSPAPWQER